MGALPCAGPAPASFSPKKNTALSDWFGHPKFGFFLATGFATLLPLGALINKAMNTARAMLEKLDYSEYEHSQV
jgi:hypothetical protein